MELEILEYPEANGFVSEGKFGVQDTTGNFFGEFDTRYEAEQFIKAELDGIVSNGETKL